MIVEEIKILKSHGWQYVPDVTKVELTPLFRGRPEIKQGLSNQEKEMLVKICPTEAIQANPFSIDLGACVFCKECEFACPDKIKFVNDYKTAVTRREDLIITEGQTQMNWDTESVRPEIQKMFSGALKLRQISAAGDNSCEMELNAAGNVNFDMGRFGIQFVASPRHADGIVITGPVSENMAEALRICYDATPAPKIVVLAGTDAISGGIYAGSKALDRSFIDNYKIDLYVPGNPMHPLTFINGLLKLIGKID